MPHRDGVTRVDVSAGDRWIATASDDDTAMIWDGITGKPLVAPLPHRDDVPFAPARLTEEGFDDPQVIHNRMVATLEDPAVGPVVQMGVPAVMTATPGAVGPSKARSSSVAWLSATVRATMGVTSMRPVSIR